MSHFRILVVCISIPFAIAQLPNDTLPSFTWTSCQTNSSCVSQSTSLTLDSNWRRFYSTADHNYDCYSGNRWNSSLCRDNMACVNNCEIDSVPFNDYEKVYGVQARSRNGTGELRLRFVTKGEYGANYGSRLFFLNSDRGTYESYDTLDLFLNPVL